MIIAIIVGIIMIGLGIIVSHYSHEYEKRIGRCEGK